jgi:O-antigen/teichoic acid export membrane protein
VTKYRVLNRDSLKKVWNGEDSLLVNSFFLFGILVVSSGFGFLVWLAASRLYSPDAVGLATTVISTSQLLTGLAGLGLGMGLIKFLPAIEQPARMVNTALLFTVGVSILASLVYVLGAPLWSPSLAALGSREGFLFAFLLCAPVFGANSLMQMVFQALRQSKYGFWMVVITNLLRLLLTFLLASWGAGGIIAAMLIGMFLSVLVGVLVFLPRALPGYRFNAVWHFPTLKQLFPFSIGVHLALQAYQVPLLLTPLLVMERLGPAYSANAYIAWMLGSLIASAGQAIAGSAFAEGSHDVKRFGTVFKRSLRLSFWITCALAVLLGVGAPRVLAIFGKSYQHAAPLLVWMALAAPFVSMNRVFFTRMQVEQDLKKLISLSLLSTIVFLFVFFLLVGRMELMVVGIGWLLSQVVLSAVSFGTDWKGRAP